MKNDKNKSIEADKDVDAEDKPKVRIVDLEEIREVLGAAAATRASSVLAPGDTHMCPW